MMVHIIEDGVHILPDGSEEVVYGGYLAVVVVLHEHWQRDLPVSEHAQHLRVHEAARVSLRARAQYLSGRGGAVVLALHHSAARRLQQIRF